LLQHADEHVAEGDVHFLDAAGVGVGDFDYDVAQGLHFAAARAREAYGDHAHAFGFFEAFEDVFGVAGGGEADGDVAFIAECADLAGEDFAEAEIVGAGGYGGGVEGQGQGGDGGAFFVELDRHFGDDVLAVRGGATIAEHDDFVAVFDGGDGGVDPCVEGFELGVEHLVGGCDVDFAGFIPIIAGAYWVFRFAEFGLFCAEVDHCGLFLCLLAAEINGGVWICCDYGLRLYGHGGGFFGGEAFAVIGELVWAELEADEYFELFVAVARFNRDDLAHVFVVGVARFTRRVGHVRGEDFFGHYAAAGIGDGDEEWVGEVDFIVSLASGAWAEEAVEGHFKVGCYGFAVVVTAGIYGGDVNAGDEVVVAHIVGVCEFAH
jgi:hypothetical protein